MDIKEYERILRKVGFTQIEIIPINIYTKEIINGIAIQKNSGDIYSEMDSDLLDGAFAGAHVKAFK